MRIAVVHHTLNRFGGGYVVASRALQVLNELGHEVRLYTFDKPDWRRIQEFLGIKARPDEEVHLFKGKLAFFGVYQRLALGFYSPIIRKGVDLVLNFAGDAYPIPADMTYIHFPFPLLVRYSPEVFYKYWSSLPWRIYFTPYELTVRLSTRALRRHMGLLVANSRFTARAVREAYGVEPAVLYPPVDVESFHRNYDAPKKDVVVTVSRLTPEKRLDLVPLVAKKAKKGRLVIVGATQTGWTKVVKKVVELARRLGVRDRVSILRNLAREDLARILGMAKVYLHTMPYEHYGIAIVEGMASGAVPVVHRTGGAWLDILEERDRVYGLAYNDVEEAGRAVDEILTDHALREEIRENNRRRIWRFSLRAFRLRLSSVVDLLARG